MPNDEPYPTPCPIGHQLLSVGVAGMLGPIRRMPYRPGSSSRAAVAQLVEPRRSRTPACRWLPFTSTVKSHGPADRGARDLHRPERAGPEPQQRAGGVVDRHRPRPARPAPSRAAALGDERLRLRADAADLPAIHSAMSIRWLPRSAMVVPAHLRGRTASRTGCAGSVNSSDSQVARQQPDVADGAVGDHPPHQRDRGQPPVVEARPRGAPRRWSPRSSARRGLRDTVRRAASRTGPPCPPRRRPGRSRRACRAGCRCPPRRCRPARPARASRWSCSGMP